MTAPTFTRDQRCLVLDRAGGKFPARVVCDDKAGTWPIVALVKSYDSHSETVMIFDADGNYCNGDYYRLVPTPKRIKGWVNVYTPYIYSTPDAASRSAAGEAVACVYIDVAEGEGLEKEGGEK